MQPLTTPVPRPRRLKRMGLSLGPVAETPAPAQIPGVEQRAGPTVPQACPHCHAPEGGGWARDAWQGHCQCGTTWYRAVHALPAPRSPHIRRSDYGRAHSRRQLP